MAAIAYPYTWDPSLTYWSYYPSYAPPADKEKIDKEAFAAFVKRCKREERAAADRQIFCSLSAVQAKNARDTIKARQRFLRVKPKRQTDRLKRRTKSVN